MNKRRVAIAFFLCFLVSLGYAQKTKIDTAELREQSNRLISLAYQGNDSTLQLSKDVIAKAYKVVHPPSAANAYFAAGIYYQLHTDNDEFAFQYLDTAEAVALSENNILLQSRVLYHRGTLHTENSKYDLAIQSYLPIIQNLATDSSRRAKIYSLYAMIEMGKAYYMKEDYENSLLVCKRAENLMNEYNLQDEVSATSIYNIQGNVYLEKDPQKALQVFRKTEQICLSKGDSMSLSVAWANIASTYIRLNKLDSAGPYLKLANAFIEHHQVLSQLAAVRINTGIYYTKGDSLTKARELLHKGITLADEKEQFNYLVRGYSALMELYEKSQNIDSALYASKQKFIASQKLHDAELAKERQRLITEFEFDLTEAENQKLKQEASYKDQLLSQQKQANYILLFALILIFSLGGIAYYAMRKAKKAERDLLVKNRDLQDLNERKNQLLSIVSHDLRSPITNMLQMHTMLSDEQLSAEERAFYDKTLTESITNGLSMLDSILHFASSYLRGDLVIEPVNILKITEKVVEQCKPSIDKKEIKIVNEVPRVSAFGKDAILEIVFRNVLTNAVKFSPIGSTVRIFLEEREHEVVLFVNDQGEGMDEEMLVAINNGKLKDIKKQSGTLGETGSGIGFKLSQDLARRMKAQLYIAKRPEAGTTVAIALSKVRL